MYAILVRENQNRLRDFDCLSKRCIRPYERARLGELVHIDAKKQSKIPLSGGLVQVWSCRDIPLALESGL